MRGWRTLTFWSCVCLGVVLLSRQTVCGAPPSGWRPVRGSDSPATKDSAITDEDWAPVLGLFELPSQPEVPPTGGQPQSAVWLSQIPSLPPNAADQTLPSPVIPVAAELPQVPRRAASPPPAPPAELPFSSDLLPISPVPVTFDEPNPTPVISDRTPEPFFTAPPVASGARHAPDPSALIPPAPFDPTMTAFLPEADVPSSFLGDDSPHFAFETHHCEHCSRHGVPRRTVPYETEHHGEFASFGYLGGWFGNRRVFGDGGIWLPLWQSPDSLVSLRVSGRADDRDAGQFHLGLGYRTYLNPDWIFGGHAYYDLFRSGQKNVYHQATVGAELMSLNWDFRINGHFPQSGGRSASSPRTVSNGTIVTRNSVERAYAGVDAEIGRRILRWGWNDDYEVRWFLGGYYFDHTADGYGSFGGPQTRLEFRVYDLPLLGVQSRIVCGAEASWDSIRQEQVAAFLNVRIPLCGWRERDRLDPVRRRMLDQPVHLVE